MNTPYQVAKENLQAAWGTKEERIRQLETQVQELREALEKSQKIAVEYAEEMGCTPRSGVCIQIEKNRAILEKTS